MSELAVRSSALRGGVKMTPVPSHARANRLAAWLVLFGLIIPPAEVQIYIGGLKFTIARIGIFLLLFPAILMLLQKGRRWLWCDLFAAAMAIWIPVAALNVGGTGALSSAGAESIEFFGGYIVARAYFFGAPALRAFVNVLKPLAIAAVVLAMADSISGRLIVHDTLGAILGVTPIDAQSRMGTVRATSTFDHAILFGTFCAVTAAILLYAEANFLKRIMYVGLCLFGAILSLSSSSLMGLGISFATYAYDRLLRQFPWRWSLCWAAIGTFVLLIVLVTKNPLGWILSNLTLDPASGYFRLLEWDAAFYQISLAPWTGYAFTDFGTAELFSVDSVWLVMCLRFGIPTVALLILANVTAMLPIKHAIHRMGDPYLERMRTAFSLVLVLFMFIGITVHYWNYMWIFWGVCVGIRASLREHEMSASRRAHFNYRPVSIEIANGRLPKVRG